MSDTTYKFNDIRDHEDIHRLGDHVLYAEAWQGEMRLLAVDLTASMQKLQKIHDLSPSATEALGQLCMTSLLLASDLKDANSWLGMTLQTAGDLGRIQVECQQNLNFRAKTTSPHAKVHINEQHQLDLTANFKGGGRLQVMRSFASNKAPFVSQTELLQAGLTQTLAYYLAKSEQRQSCLILQTGMSQNGIDFALGLLLEALPNATSASLDKLEQRVNNMPALSWFVANKFDTAHILDMLMMDENIKYLKRQAVELACSCSLAKMQAALCSLQDADWQSLISEKELTMSCDYCKKTYTFTQAELLKIRSQAKQASAR